MLITSNYQANKWYLTWLDYIQLKKKKTFHKSSIPYCINRRVNIFKYRMHISVSCLWTLCSWKLYHFSFITSKLPLERSIYEVPHSLPQNSRDPCVWPPIAKCIFITVRSILMILQSGSGKALIFSLPFLISAQRFFFKPGEEQGIFWTLYEIFDEVPLQLELGLGRKRKACPAITECLHRAEQCYD